MSTQFKVSITTDDGTLLAQWTIGDEVCDVFIPQTGAVLERDLDSFPQLIAREINVQRAS